MLRFVVKYCLCFWLLFIAKGAISQTYYLNNGFSNGTTISTCSGLFYDSDISGYYGANENYSVTFCPTGSGKIIQLLLSKINIAAGDTLLVYDGDNLLAPCIDTFTGISYATLNITPTSLNITGCLTFRFVSDNNTEAEGWAGQLRCIYPCTQPIAAVLSSPMQDTAGNASICFGNAVALNVQTSYTANNLSYHQSDSTSLFHWVYGDGADTTGYNLTSIQHLYKKNGGYYARVTITDSNGCAMQQRLRMPVRTSITPVYNISVPQHICLYDTLLLQPATRWGVGGLIDTPMGSFFNIPVSGDSVFLPDNPPQCFSSSIFVDQFPTGQTLVNASDLKGIFIKMEHSYVGDITISITAPNGKTALLKSTYGGTGGYGTYLGEPVDETLNGGPYNPALLNLKGKGYEYVFNSNPQYGTMLSECNKYLNSYTDNTGQVVMNHAYLPAGTYTAEQGLAPLLGTPLNGNWTLEICDKQVDDNGFLFNWKIEFDPGIVPGGVQYVVPIVSEQWLPAPGILNSTNTIAQVSPKAAGNYAYTFRVSDQFGCVYDTTMTLPVKPLPNKPRLGNDKKICIGQATTLHVYNLQSAVTYWWNDVLNDTIDYVISQPGTYWVKAVDTNGCTAADTIDVFPNLPFKISLGNDTLFCASKPNVLQAIAQAGIVKWVWNTGDSTASITIHAPGAYWLQGKNTGGCWVRDSIIVSDNPVNSFALPGDSSICDHTGFNLQLYPPDSTVVTWQNGQAATNAYLQSGNSYAIAANRNGCITTSVMKVISKPLPVFNLGNDTTLCKGYELPLHGSFALAKYKWNTGATDSFITAYNKGLYWVEATFNGCTFRDSVMFNQKSCNCDIVMPNAFSPNGDGVNDMYRPYIKCFPRGYQLNIFNRYGQQVFTSTDYRALWDGRYHNQPVPPGTYYYILTFYNEEMMRTERTSGGITVLR